MSTTPQVGTRGDRPIRDILGYRGIDRMSLEVAVHCCRGEKDTDNPSLPWMP